MSFEGERRVRTEVEGSERTIPADLVLIAMGFARPESLLVEALGLATDVRGNIRTGGTPRGHGSHGAGAPGAPGGSYATSLNAVFAAGDARRGQSLVVWALTEGREAAEECHAFLNG
jgi:glutamate synthase (NADPH/NADH) small chain